MEGFQRKGEITQGTDCVAQAGIFGLVTLDHDSDELTLANSNACPVSCTSKEYLLRNKDC